MGRPSELTPKVRSRIVAALKRGNTRRNAAALAGICETTLYNYLARGEDNEAPRYAEFLAHVKEAEAFAEDEAISLIKSAAHDTWTAAAWYLERKRPDDWGKRDRMDVTSGGESLKVIFRIPEVAENA